MVPKEFPQSWSMSRNTKFLYNPWISHKFTIMSKTSLENKQSNLTSVFNDQNQSICKTSFTSIKKNPIFQSTKISISETNLDPIPETSFQESLESTGAKGIKLTIKIVLINSH